MKVRKAITRALELREESQRLLKQAARAKTEDEREALEHKAFLTPTQLREIAWAEEFEGASREEAAAAAAERGFTGVEA